MNRRLLLTASLIGWLCSIAAAEPTIVNLWPGKPPGETKELPPEENVAKPDDKPVGERRIVKITNVSTPTLSIYRPAMDLDTHAAVIVCPGGGHNLLAFDHEGTEVAEWLAKRGVTGIVLKYRVPFRNPDQRWQAAVQDAQRAVSVVRSLAKDWQIDQQRIGLIGFSAGGETAAMTAILHAKRHYDKVDAIDEVSCRPDFVALIYPGGLTEKEDPWKLREFVKPDATTPPMFFAHSADDRVTPTNSILLFSELKKLNVPAEMHIYASGGHGWGMRQTGHPCNSWIDRYGEWLKSQGWLDAKPANAAVGITR
jgi:acetyl esterase/lipase